MQSYKEFAFGSRNLAFIDDVFTVGMARGGDYPLPKHSHSHTRGAKTMINTIAAY